MTNAPRTYAHLEGFPHKPTAYDIASLRLLTHPHLGIAVATPGADWRAQHATRGAFGAGEWAEAFTDPRETTYASYVALAEQQETFVRTLLEAAAASDYDQRLSAAWIGVLDEVVMPLRHAGHGLMMLSSYVAELAPVSQVVIAALFQAADEVRRVQWLSYRLEELSVTFPDFGSLARTRWQQEAGLQPLRRVLERQLVVYDWGQAFAGTHLVLKPYFDHFLLHELSAIGDRAGDDVFARLCYSLDRDARWHADWARVFARIAVQDAERSRLLRNAVAGVRAAIDEAFVAAFELVATRIPIDVGEAMSRTRAAVDRKLHEIDPELCSQGEIS